MNLLFMDLNLNIFSFALKCYFTSTLSSIYKGLVHYGSIKGNLEFLTSSIFYNFLTESGIRAFFFFWYVLLHEVRCIFAWPKFDISWCRQWGREWSTNAKLRIFAKLRKSSLGSFHDSLEEKVFRGWIRSHVSNPRRNLSYHKEKYSMEISWTWLKRKRKKKDKIGKRTKKETVNIHLFPSPFLSCCLLATQL